MRFDSCFRGSRRGRLAIGLFVAGTILFSSGILGDETPAIPSEEPSPQQQVSGSALDGALGGSIGELGAGIPGRDHAEVTPGSETSKSIETTAPAPLQPRARPRPDDRDRVFHLSTPLPLQSARAEAGRSALRPTALAAGDFDEDGVEDLVCGHAGSAGGVITLHRGNLDAIFPHSPGASARRLEGGFSDDPFLSPARSFDSPVRPDFLASGDFDCDGHQDVALAASGDTTLYLLAGDGRGGLKEPERLALPGEVTTLVAGEVNRRDGLTDLAVGVSGPEGSAVLVYEGPEGAFRSTVETIPLAAPARALLLAPLEGGPWYDLAVAAGDELLIVQGRDRRLVASQARRDRVGPPVVESVETPGPVKALAWGDFAWEPFRSPELALLLEDGSLGLMKPSEDGSWETIGQRELPLPAAKGGFAADSPAMLLALRSTGSPTFDLGIFDASAGRAQLLGGLVLGAPETDFLSDPGTLVELESAPLAALTMRLNEDALSDLVLLDPGLETPLVMRSAARATITVDSDLDLYQAGDGACTLREALYNANSDSDLSGGDCAAGAGVDLIQFNIFGGGVPATIALTGELPSVVDPATLDGTSQGCASPPCIVLDGSGAGIVQAGIQLAAGTSTLRGFVIEQCYGTLGVGDAHCILVTSSANIVEGNFCGTDLSGTLPRPNEGAGIRIEDSTDNTIGGTAPGAGNLVATSVEGNGILLANVGVPTDNEILGNLVGTDVTGMVRLGFAYAAISINGWNNTIGGTALTARNVVSGGGSNGIYLPASGGEGNLILGNYVGTDITGTIALGNGPSNKPGVWVGNANNTVGGTAPYAGNLVSGNLSQGVHFRGSGQLVLGNFIGTKAGGAEALGNGNPGIGVYVADDCTIGGTVTGARNLISGNENNGVFIYGSDTPPTQIEVLGNFIGTDVTGTRVLPNLLSGIRINGGAHDNSIGTSEPFAGNLISGNGLGGIYIYRGQFNTVSGNLIGTDITITEALGNGEYSGIDVWDADNTIGGLEPAAGNIVSGNIGHGIVICSPPTCPDANVADRNQVLGNYIGVDITGAAPLGNGMSGIEIWNSKDNTIGGSVASARNIISANGGNGVGIGYSGAQGNVVIGNFIGTDVSGTQPLGNGSGGVVLGEASNNRIGGTEPGERNLISGNESNGIWIYFSSETSVLNNLIGTDVTGTVAMGNALSGVRVYHSPANTIGGPDPEARNIISANGITGISILQPLSQGNVVQGNYIGTDVTGSVALGNLLAGIEVEGGSDNTIGGATAGAGNVISGNGDGQGWGVVLQQTSGNEVLGNTIGARADGTSPLGNTLGGVIIESASDNTIGGTGVTPGRCDGPCNRIVFNAEGNANDGVRVYSGSGNAILGNCIHSSGELGIDLEDTGVTPNDEGDADSGANDVQNFPVLTLADATPSGVTVEGTLNSSAGRPFRIEFFANTACDPSGCGEGSRYLGFADVSTDLSGNASFSTLLTGPVSDGEAITSTATSMTDSTSEFSDCLDAVCLSTACFGQTIEASDGSTLSWGTPDDVRFVKGDLADVGSYLILDTGELPGAVSMDIAPDAPPAGEGLYYVVRSLACGSWETTPGAEPGRDAQLP